MVPEAARRKIILQDTLALVLAGGQGERLYPLTRDRSKPAVPFGGVYRIVDFTLSNCLNSGIRKIYVLTQYKSGSLERHIKLGWDPIFSPELNEWIYTVPPQLRVGQRWYRGTADAVYQNVYLLQRERPRYVIVLSGDHVYRMDYNRLLAAHRRSRALATVAAVEVPLKSASDFGVLEVDADHRIVSFQEKPEDPAPIPGKPDRALVNMGVYCFGVEALVRALCEDARRETRHDFGRDILPSLVPRRELFAYPFVDAQGDPRYWRDIGTLDGYYAANMELVSPEPPFDLFETSWPIRTMPRQLPPARIIAGGGEGVRDSILGGGVTVLGGRVERSVLSPEVAVEPGAVIEGCVLMDRVRVGRGARLRNAVVDKTVRIPPRFTVGLNPDADRRAFRLTPRGTVIVPRESIPP